MDWSVVIAAGVGAVPATVAALRSGVGVREIRRVRSMLHAHIGDPSAHERKIRPIQRKEGA
jgi:hypothetical protein